MPRTKQRDRVYCRERGGERRYYADFRDFADVGGGREALLPPGGKVATTDLESARLLADRRLVELDGKRRGLILHGVTQERVTLAAYARDHLVKKKQTGKFNPRWLNLCELHLTRACEFFGGGRDIQSITVPDVQRWMQHLTTRTSNRNEVVDGVKVYQPITSATIRQHLNSLSNLYKRAISEHVVPVGYNPPGALIDKPTAEREEAAWLEVHEAALLLESARLAAAAGKVPAHVYPLIATFLLTGGRRAEVLGLEVADVSFDHKAVRFRKNVSRHRLKTRTSQRTVPLWPQLEEILRPYVFSPDRPPTRLLFPRFGASGEGMLTDFRKVFNRVTVPAGWQSGAITSKMFRHTYCSARLATLDRGAPVSPDTVSREMGHSSRDLVEQVYGHLGRNPRHRADVVEYRAEQHAEILGDRLAALYRHFKGSSGTTADTGAVQTT
jgi:integrase